MYILIEGTDGSGKNTQAKLLTQVLNESYTYDIATMISFPTYEKSFFGKEVGKYLNGLYGTLEELPPQFPILLYALDRYENINLLKTQHKFKILDRYVPSNICHQCSKINDPIEQEKLQHWIEHIEYKVLGLPKPDLVIFLDIPIEETEKLILLKEKREYTELKKDLHESNKNYLNKSRNYYLKLSKQDSNWEIINCFTDRLKSIEEIHHEILYIVQRYAYKNYGVM